MPRPGSCRQRGGTTGPRVQRWPRLWAAPMGGAGPGAVAAARRPASPGLRHASLCSGPRRARGAGQQPGCAGRRRRWSVPAGAATAHNRGTPRPRGGSRAGRGSPRRTSTRSTIRWGVPPVRARSPRPPRVHPPVRRAPSPGKREGRAARGCRGAPAAETTRNSGGDTTSPTAERLARQRTHPQQVWLAATFRRVPVDATSDV